MRILVTGGAGFIGSHYVRSLLCGSLRLASPPGAALPEVTVLDSLTYAGNRANLDPVAGSPGLRFVCGDVGDAKLVAELLPGHDAVVHFAAETHVDRSIAGGAAFLRTNLLGTHTLLEVCRRAGGPTFLHVSTDEVYGSVPTGATPESAPLRPSSPYAASKAGADLLALAHARTYGLDVRVTRCSNNYGPYQHPEKLIPRFVTTLLDGGQVPLYGDGRQARDWLHVDDHCRAVQLVLDKGAPGGVYNIGGGAELSNLEVTARLLRAVGADWDRVRHVADRPGHDRRYCVDSSKIAGELGFEPRVPFERGLAETVQWYADNRAWWEPLTDGRR